MVYNAETRTFFGVSPGSDKLVREEREWPIDTGQLPMSICTMNEQLDSPFGIPFPRMIWHEQQMFNKVWTILSSLVERTRHIIAANGSAFDQHPEQLDNLLNPATLVEAIVSSGNPKEIMQIFQVGQIDGQLIGLLFQLKEQMREVLGISSFDRGQRANVETADESSRIGAGAAINRGRIQAKVEQFWVDIFRYGHRALLQTEDSRTFTIPIVGEDNALFLTEGEIAAGFVNVGIGDLAGEFDYGIKSNSTTPHDPAAEFNALHTAYRAAGGPGSGLVRDVAVQKRLFELAGQDPQQMVVPQEVAEAQGQNNPEGGAPAAPSQPSPIEGVPNASDIPGAAA